MTFEKKNRIIAIDGPAASGKSKTARLVAERLNFLYLDTGAMYRALTYKALQNRTNLYNEEKLTELAENSKIELVKKGKKYQLFLDGVDVTQKIRKKSIDRNVSLLSSFAKVRRALVKLQRQIGKGHNLVVEGRDTTTVVFPKADLKIYLDASLKTRAQRRLTELAENKINTTLKEQIKELFFRDSQDQKRKESPLRKAPDAVVIDTTNLTIQEQVQKVLRIFKVRNS